MANIQLGTTLAAATGTGALFIPYKLVGDVALYVESGGSGVAPAQLQLRRTDPKPTSDYVGASKGEVKLTRWYTDTAGRRWPAIVTISSSIPDFRTDAEKTAFISEAVIAAAATESRANLATRAVPQS